MDKRKRVKLILALCLSIMIGLALLLPQLIRSASQRRVFDNGQTISAEEKLFGLSLIWRDATRFYAYWDEAETDWDEAYIEAIDDVMSAATEFDYYNELRAFVAKLGDGHCAVYSERINMARAYNELPFRLAYTDGDYIVLQVKEGFEAELPVGSVIKKIGNMSAKDYLENAYGRYVGLRTAIARETLLASEFNQTELDSPLTISGISPLGKDISLDIEMTATNGSYITIDEFSSIRDCPAYAGEWMYPSFSAFRTKGNICVAKIDSFSNGSLPAEFDEWINENVDASVKGIILDIRGNSGGNGAHGISVLSHFIETSKLNELTSKVSYVDPVQASSASFSAYGRDIGLDYDPFDKSPETERYLYDGALMLDGKFYLDEAESIGSDEASNAIAIDGYEPSFDQPVVILTDCFTGSAGEDIAALAKGCGRFTLMGTNTMGATGQILITKLPSDMLLLLSVRRIELEDGSAIAGRGIKPDIWVEQSIEDIYQGIDTVMSKAVEYLSGM